jgi:hypothetical protein
LGSGAFCASASLERVKPETASNGSKKRKERIIKTTGKDERAYQELNEIGQMKRNSRAQPRD